MAVLSVKNHDAQTTFTEDSVARYVDFAALKRNPVAAILHNCLYQSQSHTITCYYPNVHLKAAARLAPQQAVCLAEPAAMGAPPALPVPLAA